MASRVLSGPRARFKINGQKVAYASGVSGEESIDLEPVDVLDMIEVLEHVPVAYRCNLNTHLFRVVGASVKNLGIFPKNENILTSGVLEASIEDTILQRPAYLFQGVRAAQKTFESPARGLVSENMNFVGIRCLDESSGI